MENSPNWNNAPKWAQYWAVDQNGMAYWYEHQPFNMPFLFECEDGNTGGWDCHCKSQFDKEDFNFESGLWTKTLQQRPTNALPENGPKEPEYFKVTKGRNYLTGWPDTGF